ncbi:MAG: branched-chain amino acid transport system permease protein [Gaiellaceae bacterium]|nr:branched-chain amino acid transport system permease protein [Gaiellaceae bacterium]
MNVHLIIEYTIDGISLGSLFALFSLGIGLLFGIMRLINFAHGELIMIGAYGFTFIVSPPWPIRILIVLGLVVIAAVAMERVAFRYARGADPDTLLVTSFAISFLLQNLAILVFGALPRSVALYPFLTDSVHVGTYTIPTIEFVTVGTTAVLLVSVGAFLNRTRIGVQMRASAENFTMARLLGVRANTVIATAFALSGLLAGAAAFILVEQTGIVQPTIGVSPVLAAFVATILGGLGSLTGAVMGGFFLGGLTVALQALLPLAVRSYRDAFVFGIVLLVLVLRPQGLLVHRSTYVRV